MMKTLDALHEVSQEMQLMANYLRLVAHEGGTGADFAGTFSRKIIDLQRQIEDGVRILEDEGRKTKAISVAPFLRAC